MKIKQIALNETKVRESNKEETLNKFSNFILVISVLKKIYDNLSGGIRRSARIWNLIKPAKADTQPQWQSEGKSRRKINKRSINNSIV